MTFVEEKEFVIKEAENLKLEMEKHKDFLLNIEDCKTTKELNKLVGENMRRVVVKNSICIEIYTEEDILDEAKAIIYREYYSNIEQLNTLKASVKKLGRIGLIISCASLYEGFEYNIFMSALDNIINDTKNIEEYSEEM